MKGIRFLRAGDAAMVAELGDAIDESINHRVQLLSAWLEDNPPVGVKEVLPTFRSVTIFYDPQVTSFQRLGKSIRHAKIDEALSDAGQGRLVEIPCCYGGTYGEDLPELARLKGLSEREIVSIHSQREYLVYMLGFLPGFVYLGGLDERIHAPRLETPRVRIPAGAVGIGGSQTGVYPLDSPGGWRLIGRTPLRMYDPQRAEPFLCQAGDRIRFVPIDEAEYRMMERQVAEGNQPSGYRMQQT